MTPQMKAEIFAKAVAEGHAASVAETELATALAKDWCEQWGGWPADAVERACQVWAFRPQARRLLCAMKRVAKSDRRALASAIAA